MKIKLNDRLIIFLLILLLISISIVSVLWDKDGKRCVGNPFTYGANKVYKENKINMTCQCFFSDQRYKPMYYDKDSVWSETFEPLN